MKDKITCSYLGEVEADVAELGEGKKKIAHAFLLDMVLNHVKCIENNVHFMYRDIQLHEPGHYATVCTMADVNNRRVEAIGESTEKTMTTERMQNFPVKMAYNRAFDAAAIAFLGFPDLVYSDMRLDEEDINLYDSNPVGNAAPATAEKKQEPQKPAETTKTAPEAKNTPEQAKPAQEAKPTAQQKASAPKETAPIDDDPPPANSVVDDAPPFEAPDEDVDAPPFEAPDENIDAPPFETSNDDSDAPPYFMEEDDDGPVYNGNEEPSFAMSFDDPTDLPPVKLKNNAATPAATTKAKGPVAVENNSDIDMENDPFSIVITCGRHKSKGWTVRQTAEEDPSTIEWIATEMGRSDKYAEQKDACIKWLEQQKAG